MLVAFGVLQLGRWYVRYGDDELISGLNHKRASFEEMVRMANADELFCVAIKDSADASAQKPLTAERIEEYRARLEEAGVVSVCRWRDGPQAAQGAWAFRLEKSLWARLQGYVYQPGGTNGACVGDPDYRKTGSSFELRNIDCNWSLLRY